MSLARDTLLFGIALVAFGIWVEIAYGGGWPFADVGIVVAAAGFLGSVGSFLLATSDASEPAVDES